MYTHTMNNKIHSSTVSHPLRPIQLREIRGKSALIVVVKVVFLTQASELFDYINGRLNVRLYPALIIRDTAPLTKRV